MMEWTQKFGKGAVVSTAKHSGCFLSLFWIIHSLAIVATVLVVDAEICVFTQLKPKGIEMNSKFIHHDSSFEIE